MKKQIKTTEAIFPMPVLLIATFNEDGTVNVMNAAWGTMVSRDIVALNLTETHTTVQNIKARKGFVVHIADAKHVTEADWFGVVSGSKGSYIDNKAKGGKFYSYKLSACNGKVNTGYSPLKSMWRLRTPKMPQLKYAKSSGLEVRWKKIKGASYYSIQYSYSSDFRKKKTVHVKANAPRQLLIKKKLKTGKTCYVRVYACHKGGKKVYSQPSATGKIKIH